jgi:hypothetical protein
MLRSIRQIAIFAEHSSLQTGCLGSNRLVLGFIRMMQSSLFVMPSLVPGIHGSLHLPRMRFVDGRIKSGHDEG